MRTLFKTSAFNDYYSTLPAQVQEKIEHVINILSQQKVVNSKFVKKLENTDYYELRISTDNEYRFILFAVDHPNIIEATQVILMNGFIKKSSKDYKKQIKIAERIIQEFI
jgi:hypothetical protein